MASPTCVVGDEMTGIMATPSPPGKLSQTTKLDGKDPVSSSSAVSRTPGVAGPGTANMVAERATYPAVARTILAMRNARSMASSELTSVSKDTVPGPDATDSDDVASDWAEAHSIAGVLSSSEAGTRIKTTPRTGKASGVKNVPKRARARANSDSSGGTPERATKKRVRTTAVQRQAPTARLELPLGDGRMAMFTSTIYVLELGSKDRTFHAHENAINRSPKLREEVEKARANRRATKQNVIRLMHHDGPAFEQMISYLYNDKFELSNPRGTALARMTEIKDLMSLAKQYELTGLQRQVVKMFAKSQMFKKVTPAGFFDWAEDMYYAELDHETGAFKAYLARTAPAMMRGLQPNVFADLCGKVRMGGGFAEELFRAAHSALTTFDEIKQEPGTTAIGRSSSGESLFMNQS